MTSAVEASATGSAMARPPPAWRTVIGEGDGDGEDEGEGDGVSACPTMPMSDGGAGLLAGLPAADVETVAATSINSRTATRSLRRRRPSVCGVRRPSTDFS